MLTRRVVTSIVSVLAALVMTTGVVVPSVAQATPNPAPSIGTRGDVRPTARGIAAAWFYLADNPNYRQIPPEWSQVNFRKVDLLVIGPLGIQPNVTFGLYKSAAKGDLAKRFSWVVARARIQNPTIRIVVSQWWGDQGASTWGKSLAALRSPAQVRRYAQTVAAFFRGYQNFFGGLNGFDVDYESDNAQPITAEVFKHVRVQLNALQAQTGRQYIVTASPATTDYLRPVSGLLNYAFLQTYAGGFGLTPADFRKVGFKSGQMLYGICPETNCETETVARALAEFQQQHLAGVHNWRLNSDNFRVEGAAQAQVYAFMHPRR